MIVIINFLRSAILYHQKFPDVYANRSRSCVGSAEIGYFDFCVRSEIARENRMICYEIACGFYEARPLPQHPPPPPPPG